MQQSDNEVDWEIDWVPLSLEAYSGYVDNPGGASIDRPGTRFLHCEVMKERGV